MGILSAGTVLKPSIKSPTDNYTTSATLAQDGRIFIDNHAYETPLGAAKAYHQRKGEINGWSYWLVARSGKRLNEIRDEYLESIGQETVDTQMTEQALELLVD
jgi:hypothetical protein